MFSKFMYLETHREKMLKLMKTSSTFGACIKSFLGCGGFRLDDHHYLQDPLDTVPEKIYLVQIMSYLNDLMCNQHCIVIYNGKLYDINHTTPLSLSQKNLDSCCVGITLVGLGSCYQSRKWKPDSHIMKINGNLYDYIQLCCLWLRKILIHVVSMLCRIQILCCFTNDRELIQSR